MVALSMLASHAALWESTGRLEMSVFQTLSAGYIGQLGAPGTGVPAAAGTAAATGVERGAGQRHRHRRGDPRCPPLAHGRHPQWNVSHGSASRTRPAGTGSAAGPTGVNWRKSGAEAARLGDMPGSRSDSSEAGHPVAEVHPFTRWGLQGSRSIHLEPIGGMLTTTSCRHRGCHGNRENVRRQDRRRLAQLRALVASVPGPTGRSAQCRPHRPRRRRIRPARLLRVGHRHPGHSTVWRRRGSGCRTSTPPRCARPPGPAC